MSPIILTASHIFSSLIRNNLNRYLKNPLFTRSLVKNSLWQGEFDGEHEHGGSSSLIVPQFSINDHHQLAMESFDGQTFPNFDLPPNGVGDFLPPSKSPMLEQNNVRFPTEKSLINDDQDVQENKLNRIHSTKSLTTTNNKNAYSSFKKIPQLSNKYINED
ncbi:hypothetical protein BLA29_011690, partial [Euroglyphus maynei]